MIHEDEIEWKFISSLNMRSQHHTCYRDENLGVQMEQITNKTNNGYGLGKSKSFFFIDKDEREFFSAKELTDAYNEKFKFNDENPNQEVKYVKVITQKK